MSQAIESAASAMVESIARRLPREAANDFRNLINQIILANLIAQAPGGNLIQSGGSPSGSSKPPVGITHSVTGANGVATVSIKNPASAKSSPIWHEVSYSPLKSFTQNVTTLPPTLDTNITLAQSGVSAFYRLRSSFDKVTWSQYQFPDSGPVAVDAGLVESSAMAKGAAFNQTNFGIVNSQASGGTAAITISGTGGTTTPYVAVKGNTQQVRPSGTIVGVTPSSQQFIGFDGKQFFAKPTLASVLADNLEPVGKVSVVSTATPTPPTIVPIVSGGSVVGYNVTSGGAGASQPYVLIVVGTGTGATTGAQTIVGGVLLAVAPGNAGSGYGAGTTVTVSGGGPGGQSGGGTAVGGNGGRLTAV